MRTEITNKWFKKAIYQFEAFENLEEISIGNTDFIEILNNRVALFGNNVSCKKQETLITDLSVTEDDIFKSFKSNYRNEIRRAEKDPISIFQFRSNELENEELLFLFTDTYKKMFKSKGMEREVDRNVLEAYRKNNNFVLTGVKEEEHCIIFHSYITDGCTAKLWQSCSLFRESESSVYRNLVGRANKYLHWKDLIYFKMAGVKFFDWGGVEFRNGLSSISNFKLGFGGRHVEYYDILAANSLKAKLYMKIKNK